MAMAALLASAQTPPQSPSVLKVLDLFARLQVSQQTHLPVSFNLTESEINEYARYTLVATPRPGLKSLSIKAFSNNYLSTFTVVDFDAVERWKPGTIPTILKPVLSGRKSIWLDFRFQAHGGYTTFTVEKAYFDQIRLPAVFVAEMIRVVAARQPEHFDTTRPVPLPFGLKEISSSNHSVSGRT